MANGATAALRECLANCQLNEGLDPLLCQDRCRDLTPGDIGCGSTWNCFRTGFELPDPAAIFTWAGSTVGSTLRSAVQPVLQAVELPLATVAVAFAAGLVIYLLLK